MLKKTVEVKVPHAIGDTLYFRNGYVTADKSMECPACLGKRTLLGADGNNYSCPRCHGRGKLIAGARLGFEVYEAKIVGMRLRDYQVGKETTGSCGNNNEIYYDFEYIDKVGKLRTYACHSSNTFATREEAELYIP